MKLRAGTSGFSYSEWKGDFYPEDIAAGDMLGYYASQLPVVEINNTFYRLPKESMLEGWAGQVSADFRFVLKASRKITHFKRLRGAEDETRYFVQASGALGKRLGALLFQLPPNFEADVERLEAFLEPLPAAVRCAFEFRHPSWFDEAIFEALRGHDRALCIADAEGDLEVPFESTAGWGYLRLRREVYSDAELEEWIRRIADQGWDEAYVFFKHEDEATGPAMARRLLELAGGGGGVS